MRPRRLLIASLIALPLIGGCVRRRMTVRTNPPGAAVFVDKQLIGTSPAASTFTYYGTREIEVVRDGYRTERVLRTISPPWYQLPPLDFISESLWPREIRDERIIDIAMVPEQPLAEQELQTRANSLRLQASQGVATPLPPSAQVSPDFRGEVLPPGVYPTQPIDPNYQSTPGAIVMPPDSPASGWRPGQLLQGIFRPGGELPTSIPEVGGSYRPITE